MESITTDETDSGVALGVSTALVTSKFSIKTCSFQTFECLHHSAHKIHNEFQHKYPVDRHEVWNDLQFLETQFQSIQWMRGMQLI
jgi:hypothetical protein